MVGSSAASSSNVLALVAKLSDPDPDYRFMALNDLTNIFLHGKTDWLVHDYSTAAKTLDGIVKSLDDTVGEVQNLAIKCLDPFIRKVPASIIGAILEKLSTLKHEHSADHSVVSMALRTVINALPKPHAGIAPPQETVHAFSCISRVLIPRFVGKVVQPVQTGNFTLPPAPKNALLDDNNLPNADTLDVLIEVVACFGPLMSPPEVNTLLDMTVKLVEQEGASSVIKKRAVSAVALLCPYVSEVLLAEFVARVTRQLSQTNLSSSSRRYLLSTLGSTAHSIPSRFAAYLDSVVPIVLVALGEDELQNHLALVAEGDAGDSNFGDVREAALVTLEALMGALPNEMRPFTDQIISSCLRYLKFDPNYAQDDDDEEMNEDSDDDFGADDDDDEFEDDGAFDDDDDASWKVRRCAAKTLYTLISTRGSGDLLENGVLYRETAPALIKKFDEREESVRLEVISAMALLVRKTGEGILPLTSVDDDAQLELLNKMPQSRKRRRQSSGAGISLAINTTTTTHNSLAATGVLSPEAETIPTSGPRADLAKVTPALVKAISKQLGGKLIGTKQAVINLLNDLVCVQRSGLAAYFDQLVVPILDAIKLAGSSSASLGLSGAASATPSTLRVAALKLTGSIARTHSSSVLQPYLSKLVDACILAVGDKFFKISSEALKAIEELVKAITPPRSSSTCQKYRSDLLKIFGILCQNSDSNSADAEVRQRAIQGLGTLLSRTANQDGAMLLPADKREMAMTGLYDRLRNETTRPSAIKAINSIACLSSPVVPVSLVWAQPVALELASQLRKSNRTIRSSSVQALVHIVQAPGVRGNMDLQVIMELVMQLQQVLVTHDTLLLAPASITLAHLAETAPEAVVTPDMIAALCTVLVGAVSSLALDAILQLVTAIGKSGRGNPLLDAILNKIGMNGDPAIVGKVIGALIVASPSPQISLPAFVGEVDRTRTKDPMRASLALTVLGEAGLRLGPKNPVEPSYYLQQFGTDPDKISVAAAVAMGRACAGNVPMYIPVMLEAARQGGNAEYLTLQAIKETLQVLSNTQSTGNYTQYWKAIWTQLVNAAQAEDNRPACAECMGRLALIEPGTYLIEVQALLGDDNNIIRAVAVQALRYTLPESDESYDSLLKNMLVSSLLKILQDPDMEIRRLAMSTLTSAAHNKPDLILPSLGQLMPFVMVESVINPELVHEVSLGPFKHTVDDGLELRKAAYETLYALMEVAFSRISNIQFFDRVIDGISDDNDIRALCNLMLRKLVIIDPEETIRRLDTIGERFKKVLSIQLKDNAVKQEIEKQKDTNKSILRVTLVLEDNTKATLASNTGGHAQGAKWQQYLEMVRSTFSAALKDIMDDDDNSKAGGSA